MPKYIDLESRECVHLLCNLDPKWKPMPEVTQEDIKQLESLIEAFHALPSVDVAEVKHGEWLACKNNSGYKCSLCGARIRNAVRITGNHNWCYKCGAKMDGKDGV